MDKEMMTVLAVLAILALLWISSAPKCEPPKSVIVNEKQDPRPELKPEPEPEKQPEPTPELTPESPIDGFTMDNRRNGGLGSDFASF